MEEPLTLLSWLRSTIEGDKAAAEAAANAPRHIPRSVPDSSSLSRMRWVNDPIPDGGAWSYEEVAEGYHQGAGRVVSLCGDDKGVVAGSCGCCGLRADGRNVDLKHIALHDPRDTIARCEAELALLDKLMPVLRQLGEIAYGEGQGAEHPDQPGEYIAEEAAEYLVELLAAGYRHRPGFKAEWTPGEVDA